MRVGGDVDRVAADRNLPDDRAVAGIDDSDPVGGDAVERRASTVQERERDEAEHHRRGRGPGDDEGQPAAGANRLRLRRRLLLCRLPDDVVEPPPLGEALEREPAAVAESDVGNRAREVADRLADQDLPALRVARDALRCVDRRAERMAAPLKHLAHVEPDADADVLRGMLAAVLFQRLVDRDGAGDRLPG